MVNLKGLSLGLIGAAALAVGGIRCLDPQNLNSLEQTARGFYDGTTQLREGGFYNLARACADGVAPWAFLTGLGLGVYALARGNGRPHP